jgi:hypothetical protein
MPRQAIKKVRATASDVANDLKNHEIMCSERWKTCFNTLERLEESIEIINDRLNTGMLSLVGFLAATLVSVILAALSLWLSLT